MAPHDMREDPPSDDAWLAALGEVARQEAAEAEAPLPESGPLRPLDAGERSDLLAAVLAAREGPAATPSTSVPSLPLAGVAAPSPPRRWSRVAAALVTLAAAVVAWVATRPVESALPTYTIEATAGAQAVRGADEPAKAVTVYAPGTRFRIVLRPAAAPPGPVRATVALRGPRGPVDWQPPIQVGGSGSVKIEGAFAGPLALPPGDYEATFTLRAGESDDDGRAVQHRFRIEDP